MALILRFAERPSESIGRTATATGGTVKYGYARVSTEDQNSSLQLNALKEAHCDHIFEDRLSGTITKRPALTKCLKDLRAGDVLVVWKMDRLGRSLKNLIELLDELKSRGVRFQSLTEAIDTETPAGRAMWQMLGVLAEFERSLIVERTRAGLKAAKARGQKLGPKHKLNREQVTLARRLIGEGQSRAQVAELFKVGRVTLYRAMRG